MKRNILWIMLVIGVLVVAGCTATAPTQAPPPAPTEAPAAAATEAPAPEPTEAPAAEPVTIQVFYPVAVDAPIADILKGYIAAFQADNPDIQVEPVFSGGYGDVKTAIQTTIDGGGQPPALAVMLATDLYDQINADNIVPLDDYIAGMDDGQAYLDDFFPAFLAYSRYDGKL
jgi:ABC-type glycerol-3-phosphate transport system substrate-binding protein